MSFPKSSRLLLLLSAVFLFAGCSTIGFYWDLYRANRAGNRFWRTYEHLERDVPYSANSDVRLDVYSPPDGDGHPVLIFIHGGGWDSYNKKLFAPVAMQLLPRDIVIVIPNYTLYPEAEYRQMGREVADAVAWTFENIAEFRGDPERVVLSGHSAGGHLSGLVAFDSRFLDARGHSPAQLAGWIGLSGVYDAQSQLRFQEENNRSAEVMTAVMGGIEEFERASPTSHVPLSGGEQEHVPRAWLIHGALDDTVPLSMAEEMYELLRQGPVATELIVYPEAAHSDFLFDALSDQNAPVLRDIGRALGAQPANPGPGD